MWRFFGIPYTKKLLKIGSFFHWDFLNQGIVINHDMTQNERDEYKKLAVEAKSKADQDTSGEYMYRIRGRPGQLKVVRIKLRT